MKFKTTKKAIKAGYSNIITIGYCNAQHLLYATPEMAYSTRAEGWACDYYHANNSTVISTGYSPIVGIRPSYDLVKSYDDEAAKIIEKNRGCYDVVKRHLAELLEAFVDEVLNK